MRLSGTHLLAALITLAAASALPWRDAVADDETDDVEVKLSAPLDAVDCAATPPTVTVLGLTIDISQVSAESSRDGGSGGETGDDGGSGDGSDDDGNGGGSGGCAALAAGQTVEVKLASDATPLAATELGGGGGEGENDAAIKAPVQAVDAANGTITVLGLTVDVSQATAEGDDDQGDGEGQGGQAIDLTQVTMGQFAEIKLDASKLPALVATEISVKNFSNQVEVEIHDPQGELGDDDSVDVSVTETVVVQGPAGASVKRVRKVLHFAQAGHGHTVVIGGLPTGRALITVSHSGATSTATGRRRTKVRPNTKRTVRVRLHAH